MADSDTFSFRWGISLLDDGYTTIPNFFLDHYAAAGVRRSEFLAIIHLARYQYEKVGSECRPSVGTVARQMGYSKRGLQQILGKLEDRGLLARHYRPGETTIYDFTGFSQTMLDAATAAGGELQFIPNNVRDEPGFRGRGEPQFMGGVNPSSPKEKQEKEKQEKEKVVGSSLTIMCEIHNIPMKLRQSGSASWYSHQLPDGSWCQGKSGRKRARRQRSHTDYRAYAGQFPDPDPVMPPNVLPRTSDQILWAQIQTELQLGMTQATYDTWLRNATAQRTDGALTITAANKYAQDWLEHRLRNTIERIVKRVAGEELRVIFAVAPEPEDAAQPESGVGR